MKQFIRIYEKHYKKFMLFSLLLLLLSFISLGVTYSRTGEFFQKGVSLKGGITFTIPIGTAVNIQQLGQTLSTQLPNADITVREITEAGRATAIIIEAGRTLVLELDRVVELCGKLNVTLHAMAHAS